MIIFIPIEVKSRENIPKIFLAYQILKYTNYKIIIGGQRFLNQKIKNFKNCIWLDKNTFHERLKQRNIDKSNHVIVLDEEGPMSLYDNFATKTLYSNFFFKLINTLILWGEKDKERLPNIKNKNVKLAILGHPKFDLLKNKYKKFFNNEVNIIKKKYKNFVFIAGSGTVVDGTEQLISLTRTWAKKYNINQNVINKWHKYNALERENYLKFLEFVKKLAIANPNTNFVFRKHPVEDENKLKIFFGKIPKNLHIIYKFSVTPWIISCDQYLHSGCTTSIEASILKKKIIFYSLKSITNHIRFKKLKFSNLNFTNEDKCISFFKNNKNFKYKARDIGSIINNNDKNSFYKNFIKVIKKVNLSRKSVIIYREVNQNLLNRIYMSVRNLILKILSFIKNKFVLGTFLEKYIPEKHVFGNKAALRKFISLKKTEINDIIYRLNRLNKKKIKVKISKISDSVYKLENI